MSEIWITVKDEKMEAYPDLSAAAEKFSNLSEFVLSKAIIAKLSFDNTEWKIEEAKLEDIATELLEK